MLFRSDMQLAEKSIYIDTTFSSGGEEGEHIKLIVGDKQNAIFHAYLIEAPINADPFFVTLITDVD